MKLENLKKGELACVVLPSFKAILTGVARIEIAKNGDTSLLYTDGEKESVSFSPTKAQQILDRFLGDDIDIFSIVGEIQRSARSEAIEDYREKMRKDYENRSGLMDSSRQV